MILAKKNLTIIILNKFAITLRKLALIIFNDLHLHLLSFFIHTKKEQKVSRIEKSIVFSAQSKLNSIFSDK